jgi:hypothetical protein
VIQNPSGVIPTNSIKKARVIREGGIMFAKIMLNRFAKLTKNWGNNVSIFSIGTNRIRAKELAIQ